MELEGKTVKVVYKDVNEKGVEARAVKIGKLIKADSDFIYLESQDLIIAIPKSIVQRIEVKK